MLKYVDTKIVFEEVPDEVSLAISISNCPCNCKGCHSSYLPKDIGTILGSPELIYLINQNKGITCVCFMGGTHDMTQLTSAINIVKENKLKACIYTGENYEGNEEKFNKILENIDYIKFGPYIEELGGLDKETTNQRFYEVINGALFADKTYLFRKSWNKN